MPRRRVETPTFIRQEDHEDPDINFHEILTNGVPSLDQLYSLQIQNCIVLFGDQFRVKFTENGPVLLDSELRPCEYQDNVTELISEYLTNYHQNLEEDHSEGEDASEETRSTEDPIPSSPAKRSYDQSLEQDAETCPICLDPWTSGGAHRLVSLKCGHLFGEACVTKWLQTQPLKERCCPTCKAKASKKDVRSIYARRLVAADNTEIELLQKKLEMVESQKNRLEIEFQKCKAAYKTTLMRLEELQSKVRLPPPTQPCNWKFVLEKNIQMNLEGGSRVSVYNSRTYELFASNKSNNTLFPGFGVVKCNGIDFKLGSFVLLHLKPIRDLAYSAAEDLILSASLDGTARLLQNGVPSFSVKIGSPLWSCAWDISDSKKFFVGGVGGVISYYDLRKADEPILKLSGSSNGSPIASLASVPGGFFSSSLTTATFWSSVSNSSGFLPEVLPVDGPFMNFNYDDAIKKVLLYCRPGPSDKSRLFVYEPSEVEGRVRYEVGKVFLGSQRSSVMCRASLVHVGSEAFVSAYSEGEAAVQVVAMATASVQHLRSSDVALDITPMYTPTFSLLAALSENRLKIYKPILLN